METVPATVEHWGPVPATFPVRPNYGTKSRSGPIWLNNYRGSARAFASIVVRVLLAASITEGYQGASKQNKAVVMF
jgi:hypothetical protein